jgi:hypothetical protein
MTGGALTGLNHGRRVVVPVGQVSPRSHGSNAAQSDGQSVARRQIPSPPQAAGPEQNERCHPSACGFGATTSG